MPDNIARIEGTDQAWYADKPAWHGKGTVSAGAKTAEQVGRAVPVFRREILTAPVYMQVGGKMLLIEDRLATYRHGINQALGIVSTDYEKLTDMDALRTMQTVITAATETGARTKGFVTGGLLGRGERGFASIDLSRIANLKVKRDPSKHEMFLIGTWTHDGSGAYQLMLWRNRVECQNMLNMARQDAALSGKLVSIHHIGDMDKALEEARLTLGLVEQTAIADAALMNALADIPIRKPKIILPGFTEYVIPSIDDPEKHERAARSRQEARDAIVGLFMGSKTLVGVPASAYRLYQAAAEYGDHYRPLRIGAEVPMEQAADRRFRSIVEGPSAELKARALEWLRQEFEVGEPVAVR